MEDDKDDNLSQQLSGLSAQAWVDFLHYSPTPLPQGSVYPDNARLHQCLQDVFHLQSFRPLQLETIHTIIEGRDCFIRMATGSGKSLLWQLPAVLQTGNSVSVTVVVCPTTSLIVDQMQHLYKKMSPSFRSLCYYAELPQVLKSFTLWLLKRPWVGAHCLLLTPDQLSHDPIKSLLVDSCKTGHLARFVIDEADKFLTWGQSFYPEYLILQKLRKTFPKVQIVAMTGSITNEDMEQCIEELGMQDCAKFLYSLDRPNLNYEVRPKYKNHHELVKDIVNLTRKGSGIIYCTYQRETKEIAALLRNRGITAQPYFGSLPEADKRQIFEEWKRGEVTVVVATTAFGMGINKHNVRWVVHDTMPSSIEGWFQESGRAGRDGNPAFCIIYFQVEDYYKVKQLITKTTKLDLKSCLKPLHQLMQILLDKKSCRWQQILNHFTEQHRQKNCGACDFCCKYAQTVSWSRQNVTVDAQNALNLLKQMRQLHPHWTEKHLAAAVFGKKAGSKFKRHGVTALEGFGCGFSLPNGQNATIPQIHEFILLLILKGVITEYTREYAVNGNTYRQCCIEPRVHAEDIMAMDLYMDLKEPDTTLDQSRVEPDHMPLHTNDSMELKVVREFDEGSRRMVDVIVIDVSA